MTVHVVSFSGGRTSAYLVSLMEQRRINEGLNVHYIFMDTGAEHPETYNFIRNVVKEWDIDLVCIRMGVSDELGKRNHIEVLKHKDLKQDLYAMKGLLSKYGTPSVTVPFCSSRMKQELAHNYCVETFGRNNFTMWIGIRDDEPVRLLGKEVCKILKNNGMPKEEMNAFRLDVMNAYLNINEKEAAYRAYEKTQLATPEQRKKVFDKIVGLIEQNISFWQTLVNLKSQMS